MIFKIVLLIALTRLLVMTDKPMLCTGLYAAVIIALGIFNAVPLGALAISGGISIVILGLYFWLLDRLQSGLLYWLVFILGVPVCIFT